jgi:hypothetical protein
MDLIYFKKAEMDLILNMNIYFEKNKQIKKKIYFYIFLIDLIKVRIHL